MLAPITALIGFFTGLRIGVPAREQNRRDCNYPVGIRVTMASFFRLHDQSASKLDALQTLARIRSPLAHFVAKRLECVELARAFRCTTSPTPHQPHPHHRVRLDVGFETVALNIRSARLTLRDVDAKCLRHLSG